MDRGGRKVGMKSNMKDAERFMPENSNAKPPTFTETGETKTIEGYNCNKVIMESEGNKGELWVTTDLKMSMQDLLTTMSANKGPGSVMLRGYNRSYGAHPGVALITHMTNKKTNE